MKKKFTTKIISAVLTCTLATGVMAFSVFAEDTAVPGNSSGFDIGEPPVLFEEEMTVGESIVPPMSIDSIDKSDVGNPDTGVRLDAAIAFASCASASAAAGLLRKKKNK